MQVERHHAQRIDSVIRNWAGLRRNAHLTELGTSNVYVITTVTLQVARVRVFDL
jgi:hypothetical protein